MPGPLDLHEEEEQNVDQDDLNPLPEDRTQPPMVMDHDAVKYKRFFYQMNFDIEFPYEDDTVYLAYSVPYQYSKIIAHMFHNENKLRAMPAT